MRSQIIGAGVTFAEVRLKDPSAEQVKRFARGDLIRWTRQSITARRSARARNQSAATQNSHQLRYIIRRDPFSTADFGDRQASARTSSSQPKQATKSVFFLAR